MTHYTAGGAVPDKLIERIKADRDHPDDMPTIVGAYVRHRMPEVSPSLARDAAMFSMQRSRVSDMESRILADAEALKAADELAECLTKYKRGPSGLPTDVFEALAAYRKARENSDD